jgi:flagella basal body P-ring formation protein FlgA
MSISVRCPAAGWSVYVPIQLRIETEVVVLKVPVGRGSRLTTAQMALETRDVTAMQSGYIRRIEEAAEFIARRSLPAGTILGPQVVELPPLVERGQRVRLIADSAGFAVEAEGEALGEAARGQRVKARNLRTKAIVEGWVDDDGNVRIGAPSALPAPG